MTLSPKLTKKESGFTIVELLIVIVVIAILAAITIVAYNGIQNRAKTTSGQSLANSVLKKAQAWSTINNTFPTYCAFATNTIAPTGAATGSGSTGCTAAGGAGPAEAKLDNTANINSTSPHTAAISDGGKVVLYEQCNSGTGGKVSYWDYAAATPAVVSVTAGTGC